MWQGAQTHTPADTQAAGAQFSRDLLPGTVVALHGGLGSGKTTFVQGVAAGLGLSDEVTSPTFALIHEYGRPARLFHLDCYREPAVERWLELGVTDYFSTDAVVLIEWPEHIEALLPPETLHLQFDLGAEPNERQIRFMP